MRKLLLLVALLSLAGLASAQADYTAFVVQAKSAAIQSLKDPSSVQYRGLYISQASAGQNVLCGEINAKNSYGAYVGFRRFYASNVGGPQAARVEDRGDTLMGILWPDICGHKVQDAN